MSAYLVSFEIKSDSDYNKRYKSLMDEINKDPTKYTWDQTTSFVVVHTDETLSELANRLYIDSDINSTKDVLLTIDQASNHCIARGPIQYEALLSTAFKKYEKK